MLTSQDVSSEAQVKKNFISQKTYVPFSRHSSFCIFNYPKINQVCDIIIRQGAFWNKSFEPQLLKSQTWATDRSKQRQ